ncbi:MAG: tetratricopeptide repeat protein [Verrucomicrobiales bacterium]|nr:tetratricopeptide repeat protein [Verrucomicrobiales bacterium]
MVSKLSRTQEPTKAVSPWFVRISVIGSLCLAAYLVPRTDELVKRLLVDGQHARALAVSVEASRVDETDSDSSVQKAVPEKSALQLLQESFSGPLVDSGMAKASACIVQAADPKACLEVVHRMAPTLSAAQREQLYLAIGHSAAASGDPVLAAKVLREAWDAGCRGETLLAETVQAQRWCGKPQEALAVINTWRAERALPAAMRDVEIAIYRELNQPGKALDRLLENLQAATTPVGVTGDAVLLASEIAANADQVPRVLPLIRDYLGRLPAGRATFQDLAEGKVKPDAQWEKFTALVAQHCEWGGRPEEAFDLYMKLAVSGDRGALDRILALDPGLNRAGDVMAVLRQVTPVPEHPELTLQLARMLADAADYDAAAETYEQWLETNPQDVAALKELAAMEAERSDQQAALRHYQMARDLAPGDLEVRKEIAGIQISLRQFREAFAFYEHLPEKGHDHTTLENYALLAESLADYTAFNRALVLRQHRLKSPQAQDFLELARSYEIVGNADAVVDTLKNGMAALPRSRVLRIELASTYRKASRYDEAIALLAMPELKSDMQAMQLFIEVCCLKEDYQFALAFLGRDFEKRFAFGPEVRLDLGHIYFNNGYLADADRLYSSVPDEPALWPLLASARFKQGNFASAETYQRKYLGAMKVPDAAGWMFLGDICKLQGREGEAKAAYDTALSQMEDKLQDTDEVEATPPRASAAASP